MQVRAPAPSARPLPRPSDRSRPAIQRSSGQSAPPGYPARILRAQIVNGPRNQTKASSPHSHRLDKARADGNMHRTALGNRPRAAARPPPKSFHDNGRLAQYAIEEKLGQGTFGIVYKGRQKRSQKIVAIKRILLRDPEEMYPVTAFREMNTVKKLRHDNIVELLEMVFDTPAPEEPHVEIVSKLGKSFYMVLPYMSFDLTGILQNPEITLSEGDNKSIMKQLFDGMHFIHASGYLHRDIKASNILINMNGLLKIADFGLARQYLGRRPTVDRPGGGHPMTEVVMTRWYRAPEVLLGNKCYTTAIDMWACGCVLGELYAKKPILPGKSDIDQAYDVFELIGDPNDMTMPGYKEWKMTAKLRLQRKRPTLRERFQRLRMPGEAISLLTNLLTLNAETRYTAEKALRHDWFKQNPLPSDRISTSFPDCHESDVLKRKEEERAKQPSVPPGPQAQPPNMRQPQQPLPLHPQQIQQIQQPQQHTTPSAVPKAGYGAMERVRPRNDFIKGRNGQDPPVGVDPQGVVPSHSGGYQPQTNEYDQHPRHKAAPAPYTGPAQHHGPPPHRHQPSGGPGASAGRRYDDGRYPAFGHNQGYQNQNRYRKPGRYDEHPSKRPRWDRKWEPDY